MSKLKVYVLGTSPSGGDGNVGDRVAALFEDLGHPVNRDHGYRIGSGRFEPPQDHHLKDQDALIVTSGLSHIENFEEVAEEYVQELITANLTLPIVAAHRYVQARGAAGGTVVLVGSYAHNHVLSNSVGYCAAKAGLDMAVRAMAWDLRATTFNVKVVHPYHIEGTPMAAYVEERVMETKGLDRADAILYSRKDIGVHDPLHGEEVAQTICRLVRQPDSHRFQTRVELYGPVR